MTSLPPIVTFAAPSGTGKTTLICGVVAALTTRGLRVGVLKHDAHRLVLDRPGKDTWRYRQAGAAAALIAGAAEDGGELGLFRAMDGEASLVGLVDRHLSDCDVVLTEGFRHAGHPVIRVFRAARGEDPGWTSPQNVVAWASDVPVATALPVLPLDDPDAIVDFLVDRFLPAFRSVPTWNDIVHGLTLVALAATAADAGRLLSVLRAPPAGIYRTLLVHAADVTPCADVPHVADLRPADGVAGALLTALAAADTPRVLVLGPRHVGAPAALLAGLAAAAVASRADVVAPVVRGHDEPLLAVYGHRCLPSLHGALLSGERRMTGWWAEVRVERVDEPRILAWDPTLSGFPPDERSRR